MSNQATTAYNLTATSPVCHRDKFASLNYLLCRCITKTLIEATRRKTNTHETFFSWNEAQRISLLLSSLEHIVQPQTTDRHTNKATMSGRENRSVSDFSTEDSLRKALLVQEGAPKVDWVLKSIDPETTQVQSMKQELHRLQVLKSYFRQEPDERLDRMTRMAARIFNAPMSLVSLVDLGRQWFISNHGWQVKETPRTYSFCAHVIQSTNSKVAVVPDATQDVRFQENPLVTGPPNIRFYAGAPLLSPEGYKVCVLSLSSTSSLSCDQWYMEVTSSGLTKQELSHLTYYLFLSLFVVAPSARNLLHFRYPTSAPRPDPRGMR